MEVFLRRPNVPVHQNLLYADEPAARSAKRGDLEMTVCLDCGFVFNRAFDPERLNYNDEYDNNQICSPSFNQYVNELVSMLTERRGLRGKTIVEVGCGKGYFIERLVQADEGNRGHGFDSTYVGPLTKAAGRLRFERRFYGPDCQHVAPDAVICRHVIEHVAEPSELVDAVRGALDHAPQARVFFETPCVEWILRNEVIWDFFYEHCSLFSPPSFRTLFERSGFADVSVQHVFNGQYLWLEARPGAAAPRRGEGSTIAALARQYAAAERRHVQTWSERVDQLRDTGGVAIWGAGAKGATFANLIDPECDRIDCVVDLNPQKQSHFIPGTGHPIVDYLQLRSRGVRHAILMNPNYERENRDLIQRAGLQVALVTESAA